MSRLRSQKDECVILVKALPHLSSNYFETVCCAGVGHDYKWRRLYPVPYRILADGQKFRRWHWVNYDFTTPDNDGRTESQKVVPESITISRAMRQAERSRLAANLTLESVAEAEARRQTLTLIKPERLSFSWKRKSTDDLEGERRKHAALANQLSMFDKEAKPLTPCPFEFRFTWKGADGAEHNHTCDDWETSTAFFKRRQLHGEREGLLSLQRTYEDEYFGKGMRFALGTHSRRSNQWLLVGVLRADEQTQSDLLL